MLWTLLFDFAYRAVIYFLCLGLILGGGYCIKQAIKIHFRLQDRRKAKNRINIPSPYVKPLKCTCIEKIIDRKRVGFYCKNCGREL